MPKKRKRETSEERIQRKISKYQHKLEKKRRRSRSPSLSSQNESIREQGDTVTVILDDAQCDGTSGPPENEPDVIKENEEEILDEEILTLLGDAPQENKFGPAIHKELASRWSGIIKTGLPKEKRTELKKTYLPPENCKNIEAPKLNLEAQAAATEMAIKRDKAIAAKQSQIGCALTALAMVFDKLYKNKENHPIINHISDAARLLCDLQHQESMTRRNFILQGLEQTTRDSVKDTEVDQWLFGENFADKLKATKAIKKSGQEISMHKPRKPQQPLQAKPLNFKGPVTNPLRSRTYNMPGPQRTYPPYKKPVAQPHSQTQRTPVSNKVHPRRN